MDEVQHTKIDPNSNNYADASSINKGCLEFHYIIKVSTHWHQSSSHRYWELESATSGHLLPEMIESPFHALAFIRKPSPVLSC